MLLSVITVGPATADRGSVHVTASGDLAFTDNVFAEQSGDQNSDLFIQVRPGILMSYGMPRMINDLSVEAEVTGYAINGNDAALTGRGTWRALFFPSPRTELVLQASGGSSLLNVISVLAQPDQALGVQPTGAVIALTADAGQSFSYQLSREFRLSQNLFARTTQTDDNRIDPTITDSREAGFDIGIERTFEGSSIALQIGGSILRFEREAPVDALMGSRLDRQRNPRARARYRRDWNRKLSLGADVGVVNVRPYGIDPYNPDDMDRRDGYFPIVGVNANYSDEWGVANASVRRDITPNLLVAQNTINDSLNAAAAFPIAYNGGTRRSPKLVVISALSLQRQQFIDPVTSEPGASFGIAQFTVGFQYAFRPGLSYGVRYELALQDGNGTVDMPAQSFMRNTIFATFRIRYPEDVAFHVPRRRKNGAASRDSPIGAEPVIPDLVDVEEGTGSAD
ncbi:MAG: hypothetical protein SFX73_13725 [Kofleriaceae bacterium]|nr:hypothetical protein [Kofleriaceae bacterium]